MGIAVSFAASSTSRGTGGSAMPGSSAACSGRVAVSSAQREHAGQGSIHGVSPLGGSVGSGGRGLACSPTRGSSG